MAKAPRITVRASGVVRAVSDRANLTVWVRAREGDRDRAVERVRHRLADVDAVLDRFSVPAHRRRTQEISERELVDAKNRKGIGYEAAAIVVIRLRDFDRLGELYMALSQCEADVHGPEWQLSSDHPAHLEVCQRAAATARQRAEAFARGAGHELGALRSLSEPAVELERGRLIYAAAGAQAARKEQGEAAVVLSPGAIRVSAQVLPVYEASPAGDGEAT